MSYLAHMIAMEEIPPTASGIDLSYEPIHHQNKRSGNAKQKVKHLFELVAREHISAQTTYTQNIDKFPFSGSGQLKFTPNSTPTAPTNSTTCDSTTMIGKTPSNAARPSSHQRVRQVALTLFCEIGFNNVSVRQLASALGIQSGSIYNHIESKRDLLFEIIEDHETDLLDEIKAELVINGTPQCRLSSYIRTYLTFNILHTQRLSVTQLDFRDLNPSQKSAIKTIRAEYISLLESIIQQGIYLKSFRPVPTRMTTSLIFSLLNEASRQIQSGVARTPEIIISLSQESVLRMLQTSCAPATQYKLSNTTSDI